MSVLIKGMKMPKDCRECRLKEYGITTGDTWCGANCVVLARNFEAIGFDGRPEWCPLVDLGKHGRLIDADKLKDKMRGKWTVYDYEALGTMPTIIEAEDG